MKGDKKTPLLKTLSWIWVIQNFILALSAFYRLQMYINYNGLTRLRIVGAYGIALVIVGLLIVTLKMHMIRNFLWMLRRQLIAFALFFFMLQITPMNWIVFKYLFAEEGIEKLIVNEY